jgi:hypothetical protein
VKMKISVLPFIALGALIAAVSFAAQDSRAVREKVEAALSQRDMPRSAQWWGALGVQGGTALREIFQAAPRLQAKFRVLEAHRFFSDAESALFLRKSAFELQNRALRRTAILSLAWSQGMKERSTFETLLASGDPFIRVAAAQGLQIMPQPDARAMLKNFLAQEPVAWVVARLKPPSPSLQTDPGLFRRLPQADDPRR